MNQSIKSMYKLMNNNTITIQEWWDYIATQDRNEVKEVVSFMFKVEDRLKSFYNGQYFRTKIRQYCNKIGYSDVYPYEVVRVISANCVEVRMMDAVQVVFPQEFIIGGFVAHCADNSNQKYEYTSNENNSVERIRKGKKGWGNGRFQMCDNPKKFHDYNF